MNMHWFFAWWNLVFILPLGLAVIYLLVMATTGLGMGETDLDTDADLDADADVDADAHLEADAGVHVDADADADGDADTDSEATVHEHEVAPLGGGGGSGHATHIHLMALSLLGLGKVPLSIVMLTLVISWSIVGLVLNAAFTTLLPQDWMAAFISLPVAAIASIAATGGIAAFIQRWFPMTQTFVTTRRDMIGTVAHALYNIDQSSGVAQIRDPHGDLFQINCRVAAGGPLILKGQSVLLVDYDDERSCFYAKPYELPATPGTPGALGSSGTAGALGKVPAPGKLESPASPPTPDTN